MPQEDETPTPKTPPKTLPASPPAAPKPTAAPVTAKPAAPQPAAPQPARPAATPAASPNLPTEKKYIDVKVGDFVEFKVRKPDGEVWRIGKVTSLNRHFADIMALESERIYCSHKEFIRRVLSKEEVAALPPSTNWYLERH